ncbi:hypothetical protein MANES_05G075950v8 [Manihot esculenta]|uniref:Uncharacterized protein n=1 Tax=Manihot esculenta TaxID=3983 RepID=A0ACB7HPK9_MANES|nr:hypothetical protein MANES_05G075950v8 [Manihot esculenta]
MCYLPGTWITDLTEISAYSYLKIFIYEIYETTYVERAKKIIHEETKGSVRVNKQQVMKR